jgi:Flp pilus assembly protein TadD
MNAGRYGEAIDLLNRFISANPQNSTGYNLRGICYEHRKEYEKSIYDFSSALKLDSRNKEYAENLERNVKNWETLLYNHIVGYKREIAINSNNPYNYLQIGKSYKNLGEWQIAEDWYDEYLKREEPSADELIRYSEILAKNNHISKGEPLLKKFAEKYPDDHRIWSRYGYFMMWLGKKKISIKAFETALELRPFFKEALDGYDLVRGKGYVYTVNDTTSRYNYGLPVWKPKWDYPIDKYYRKLKKNPADDRTRYLLIYELMGNNRYKEARDHLKILSKTQSKQEEYKQLKKEFEKDKNAYYSVEVDKLKSKYESNPDDKKTLLQLANAYSNKVDDENALVLLDEYLQTHPEDSDVRYQYALISSWNKNLVSAYRESEKLIAKSPNKLEYQLLNSKLAVWLNTDLDKAQRQLENILSVEPNNFEALTTVAQLQIQKNNFSSAEKYINQVGTLKPDNEYYLELQQSLDVKKKLNEDAEKYSLLERARESAFYKECDDAIDYYKKYLTELAADKNVLLELADAYLCKKDFASAINIYDDLLLDHPDDYDLLKQRAKIFYWNGNYVSAMKEFKKLNYSYPDDAEIKLFLGDSYFSLKEYELARATYSEMLDISPSSFIVNERLSWIGGTSRRSKFPTHMMLVPEANYFTDNIDFLYSTYGLRFDFGITDYISLGVSGYGGVLGSDSLTNDISFFKGSIASRFSKLVSASAAFGSTFFPNSQNTFLAELSED